MTTNFLLDRYSKKGLIILMKKVQYDQDQRSDSVPIEVV